MAELTRQQAEALYKLFNKYALNDQRNYYRNTVDKYRQSAGQVNTYRAVSSLLTGLASALAGLIVQSDTSAACAANAAACNNQGLVFILIIISVVAPVIGGAFSTLADLYQWDRLTTVYSAALESLEVADSLSPDDDLEDEDYLAFLRDYAKGTLTVMRDESAQWGQLIRTPEANERFVKQEQERAEAVSAGPAGIRPAKTGGSASVPDAPAVPPPSNPPDTSGGSAAG
ncbi:MAG: hypothetical protein IT324_21525 [Anaerolineae bacterium]|nr:hypothetical protein [Anaerolineae bacterium]